MSNLEQLREDVQLLEKVFPKSHERFRVLRASVDEISCQFIGAKQEKMVINANIQETYPNPPPMWFSESDKAEVETVMNELNEMENNKKDKHMVLTQVKQLIEKLCNKFQLAVPKEITDLTPIEEKLQKLQELSEDAKKYLDKLERGQPKATGMSALARDRLMKELRGVYQSEFHKKGVYQVELVNDNLYEWNVKVFEAEAGSGLQEDIKKLKKNCGQDHILLNITYKDSYPYDPPFVRVIKPFISGGHVMSYGALCMQLLTDMGWSIAYNMESVITQIISTMSTAGARISFSRSTEEFSLAHAQAIFQAIQNHHKQLGWGTGAMNG